MSRRAARCEASWSICLNTHPTPCGNYFASKLIEKGKDLKFIQTAMGHADIQLTLNVYGRLLKDKEAEHAQTADDLALELLPA